MLSKKLPSVVIRLLALKEGECQILLSSWKLFCEEIQWNPQISHVFRSGSDVRALVMLAKYV